MSDSIIRTRFSPSPTGLLHLGNIRAALFSALFAAKHSGIFVLRMEDTDQTRSHAQFAEKLQDDLSWLGLHWQEGPYWQSQRSAIYAEYYNALESKGRAYPCFCTDEELALHRKLQISRSQAPRYTGTCRALSREDIAKKIAAGQKPALRFRILSDEKIEFMDLVKGRQTFSSNDIGDFIIRRADGSSSFMFCNAIDDSLMGITHVLRGDDHLANTPRQLMILNALERRAPQYGHLSLILGDDGSPLSKRHGSFSLTDLREKGFLPVAILNYLSRLSHVYSDAELKTFSQLAEHFYIEKISASAARFDLHQLMHWQKEAVLKMDSATVLDWLGERKLSQVPLDKSDLFIAMMQHNTVFLSEVDAWLTILFGKGIPFSSSDQVILKEAGDDFFKTAIALVEKHGTQFKEMLEELKIQSGLSGKKLFMPIRVALTMMEHGPELASIATLLGRDKMKERFQLVREYAL